MRWTFALALALALLLASAPGRAQDIREIDTYLDTGKADPYVGMEYRANVARAARATQSGDDAAARRELGDVLAFCDRQASTADTRVYSVNNDDDAQLYRDEAGPDITVTFVDFACPAAYKIAAFLAVRGDHAAAAFAYLDRAEAIAPHWAEPVAERAYLVGKLGDRERSLSLYEDALAKARTYARSSYLQPLILRGKGFALTELGRLDEARAAYEASLALDPDNELAKHELRYIAELAAKTAPAK